MSSPVSVTWDSSPVQTQFGSFQIVGDGVATLADGRAYRVNASATRGARKGEIVLRYMTAAKRGHEVPPSALADVRAAALEAWTLALAPLRASIVAEARAILDASPSLALVADLDADAEELEALDASPAFLVYVGSDGCPMLCEGGVYSATPSGEYAHHTLERAALDAAEHNGASFDCSAYRVTRSAEGLLVDSTVASSLEDWQLAILEDSGGLRLTSLGHVRAARRRWIGREALDGMAEGLEALANDPERAEALAADLEALDPIARPVVGGYRTSGNLAPIGRDYRAGYLDAFQCRALLAWMSPARFAAFVTRWTPSDAC